MSLTGTETVAGAEAYVLHVEPDHEALERVADTHRSPQGPVRREDLDSLHVTNFTATPYVSTETMRPVRSVIRSTFDVDIGPST